MSVKMYLYEPNVDADQEYFATYHGIYESPAMVGVRYNNVQEILRNFVDAYMLPEPLPIETEDAVEFLTDLCRAMNIPFRRLSFKVDKHG
jgi:hypothetical protein